MQVHKPLFTPKCKFKVIKILGKFKRSMLDIFGETFLPYYLKNDYKCKLSISEMKHFEV